MPSIFRANDCPGLPGHSAAWPDCAATLVIGASLGSLREQLDTNRREEPMQYCEHRSTIQEVITAYSILDTRGSFLLPVLLIAGAAVKESQQNPDSLDG
jgi:hypothetical protein